ncbi:unnamed protein product [Agarophyton chilense]|eukprot:gb/GEZJ01001578.1/.p1 GENE.gb/GEZJ01001578.1/~~gb/GEZJ01001578.1/.p1  ORF type:complete len:250 (-),score=40.30 gb/GEZJ01001578.1/:888-1637(-)
MSISSTAAPSTAPPPLDATAPPPEAFSDNEDDDPSPKQPAFPAPPMPTLGSLGVHEPYVRSFIHRAPNWPRNGITFLDISPLLADVRALKHCIDSLAERYGGGHLTHVAGIDARGFTLGCALAYKLNCGFIMVRKAGKLPPTNDDASSLISEEYEMEYGKGQLQVYADLFDTSSVATPRVLLVDDLLATGGSARAACNLLRNAGATIVEVAVLIELCSNELCGRRRLKEEGYIDLHSLICFSEDGPPCV